MRTPKKASICTKTWYHPTVNSTQCIPWGPQSSRAELALLKEGLPAACLTTTPHLREGTEGARRRPQEKAVTHAAHLSALSG